MSLYAKAVLFFVAGTLGWWVTNQGLPVACPVLLRLAMPGLLLGVVEAASLDGTRRRFAAVVLGASGIVIGTLTAQNLSLRTGQSVHEAVFCGLFGLIVGAFLALPHRSLTLTTQYALGGLLGGVAGVGLLALLARPVEAFRVPMTLTMTAFVGVTALGIGLLPALLTRTRLSVIGKWGRDYPLVRQTLTLGSDQNADIHVPASPEVAPIHAVIELLPGLNRRRLRHAAGGQGGHAFPATRVNGRGVTGEQWLSDGDVIAIGPCQWTFHDRATRGEMRLGPAVPEAWGRVGDGPHPPTPSPASGRGGGNAPLHRKAPSGQEAPSYPRPLAGEGGPERGTSAGPGEGLLPPSARDIGRVGTRLVCTDGPYTGRVYRLGPGETRVGSHSTCAVSLPADTELSPVHARLLAQPQGGHTAEAARTDGGTWVNGARLTGPHALLPGDLIRVGSTTLRYQ